ncbi:MAG TPA: hypothetical protein VFR67_28975, partial [Pilimelia sp.]|nr:hypothetical protein [Pilimelia sp.]
MARIGGIAGLVCGRWTKWIVLAVWLLVVVVAGPLAGKLTDVQKNDNSAWLPGNAEATQVAELQKTFRSTDIAPAVLVYERTAGITPADQAKVASDARALAGVDGVVGDVVGPIPAADGQALQVLVPVEIDADGWQKIVDVVADIKEVTGEESGGLAVHVT